MRFLIEAFKKQKKRLQIEQLLLLVVRCLIVALLGFALARPLLRSAGFLESDDGRVVMLIIDDGMASGVAESGGGASGGAARGMSGGTALDRHREEALAVIEAVGAAEAVAVITTARPIEPPVLPPSLDHASVARVVESIETKESPSDLSAALRLARESAREFEEDGRTVVVYLFSDFRAGSAALDRPLPKLFEDDEERFVLLAAPAATQPSDNVQVVAIEPVRRMILPGVDDASNQVAVHLARHGGELGRGSSRVRLTGDKIGTLAPKQIVWEPGQSEAAVNFTLNYAAAAGEEIGLTAVIDDADALGLDNRRHTTLDVRERLRVAILSPPTFLRAGQYDNLTPGQWIRWTLQPGEEQGPMDIVDILPSNLTEVDLRAVDVAILTRPDRLGDLGWRALRSFVDGGGEVVVVPPVELNVHPWTDRLIEELDLPWRIDLEVTDYPQSEPLLLADEQPASELMKIIAGELSDITTAITTWRALKINPAETQADVILEFSDGTPMMIAGAPRASQVENDMTDEAGVSADHSQDHAPGLVVYLAVAPDSGWSNLPTSTFMLPLFQETLRQGMNIIRGKQNVTVGDRSAIAGLPRGGLEIVGPEGDVIDVDRNRRPAEALGTSGVYRVRDASGAAIGAVAVNVDAAAGRTDVQTDAAVGAWLNESGSWKTFDPQSPGAALAGAQTGVSLAGYMLIALLALVLVETILARRFSHAYRTTGVPGLTGGLRSTVADVRG